MIRSFRCQDTERVFYDQPTRAFPPDIVRAAQRKLKYLDGAQTVNDLRIPAGNRLELMEAAMTTADSTGAIHAGEVLREDFLLPLSLTAYRLAKAVGMTESAVSEILHGKRGITPATALRLARFFGTSPELWLNLQAAYELDAERARLGARLEAITPAEMDELHRKRMIALEERRRPLHAALPEERDRLAEALDAIQPLEQQEPAAA